MIAIWKRELRSYLKSPVGYVFLFLFQILSGLIICVTNLGMLPYMISANSDVGNYFVFISYILILLVPILTMKLFPEERKNKTDQVLITAPVSIGGMVIGKFMAAFSMFVISLLPSILSMVFLAIMGNVEYGVVIANYIGILLVAAAYIAIAMLMACVTESQIIAFMMGFFALLFFALCDMLRSLISVEFVTKALSVISVSTRFSQFSAGLFDFSSIFYFISLAVVFLFLIVRIIDKRRWS